MCALRTSEFIACVLQVICNFLHSHVDELPTVTSIYSVWLYLRVDLLEHNLLLLYLQLKVKKTTVAPDEHNWLYVPL